MNLIKLTSDLLEAVKFVDTGKNFPALLKEIQVTGFSLSHRPVTTFFFLLFQFWFFVSQSPAAFDPVTQDWGIWLYLCVTHIPWVWTGKADVMRLWALQVWSQGLRVWLEKVGWAGDLRSPESGQTLNVVFTLQILLRCVLFLTGFSFFSFPDHYSHTPPDTHTPFSILLPFSDLPGYVCMCIDIALMRSVWTSAFLLSFLWF